MAKKKNPDDVVVGEKAGGQQAGEADHDSGEDNQGDTVSDAPLGDLLAQPHQEHGAGGHGEHGCHRGQESVAGETDVGEHVGLLQQDQLGKGLRDGDGNRAPVSDPVHLDAAGLALPRHIL